jgi:hypothetical protein
MVGRHKILAVVLYLGCGLAVAWQMLYAMAWLSIWNASLDPRVLAGSVGAVVLIVAGLVAIPLWKLSRVLAAIGLVAILLYYIAVIIEKFRLQSFYLGRWYDLIPLTGAILALAFTIWSFTRKGPAAGVEKV